MNQQGARGFGYSIAGMNCGRHGYSPVSPCRYCEAHEAQLKADARAEGRREGIAAIRDLVSKELADDRSGALQRLDLPHDWWEGCIETGDDLIAQIDALIEAEKGGGG